MDILYSVDFIIVQILKLDIYYLQFIQIYLESYSLYSFNQQKVFGAKYMPENFSAS